MEGNNILERAVLIICINNSIAGHGTESIMNSCVVLQERNI